LNLPPASFTPKCKVDDYAVDDAQGCDRETGSRNWLTLSRRPTENKP
jgi:hypothetical protein